MQDVFIMPNAGPWPQHQCPPVVKPLDLIMRGGTPVWHPAIVDHLDLVMCGRLMRPSFAPAVDHLDLVAGQVQLLELAQLFQPRNSANAAATRASGTAQRTAQRPRHS